MSLRAGVLALVLLGGAQAQAQGPVSAERLRLQAMRVEQAPVVDGVLDDAAWQRAAFTREFFQKEPEQGRPCSQRTEVAFAYDADALYVGARMYSDSPEDIETVMTRRDESGVAERLIISLDTYRDRRTAYSFAVTAAGVRVDWYHPEDHEFRRDMSFNPVWEARTQATPEGWVAELRIPFSQLRFNEGEEQVWGVNINRYMPRRNEDAFWVVVPREVTAWSSRFGELTGIRGVVPAQRIEVVPYAAADLRAESSNPRAGTPFENRPPFGGRVGMDAKVGFGPNLTLDATVNPDFGQLDADPSQVNLSAFETFLTERRPFFTEGSQLLTGNGPVYFYSRRVGGAPRLSADADFVESPRASTILGATKLTGRLASGLSLGVLAALTDEMYADTYSFDTREAARVKVEPRTGYAVARGQQELGTEGSVVGATFTTVYRDIGRDAGLTSELAREAYTGGADFRLRLLGGEYLLSGYAGGSVVRGGPAALSRIQQSSAHYFQRPDQDYMRVDPEATALAGYTLGAKLERQSGTHWLWNASFVSESPGFELNDAGRLNTADNLSASLGVRYRETEPGLLLRNWDVGLSAYSNWNYGGVRQSGFVGLSGGATFANYWSSSFWLNYQPRAYSDTLTRGGPLMETGQGVDAGLALSNNFASSNRWEVGVNGWAYEVGTWATNAWASFTLQPWSRLRLSVEPSATLYTEGIQYVDTLEGGRAETYGQRYVFAAVQRRELALRLRANLFLSPDLSLEAYAEPFASSGAYSRYGELGRPRDRGLRLYEDVTRLDDGSLQVVDGDASFVLSDPDFNLRSFRSNVVLRWEWRPGSTLFVVWQQDRSLDAVRGNPLAPRSLGEALLAPGSHTFALKLNWWFPAG